MKKFNKNIKIGTKVKIAGFEEWFSVKEIHETRFWIKLNGVHGSFQHGHILKYTNK